MTNYSAYVRSAVAGLALTLASIGSLEVKADDFSQSQYVARRSVASDTTSQQDTSSRASIGYGVLGLALIVGIDLVNRKIEEKIFSKHDP